MKRLLTFEAFVPKNLEKRAKDLEIIKAKELAEFEIFFKEFQKNLAAIKNKTSNDPKEQLFIDLMKDCLIKTDQGKYPFIIFLFKDDMYMFEYNWKNEYFRCSFDRIWSVFKQQFKVSYEDCKQFITDQVEAHFKFRPSTTIGAHTAIVNWIEAHFKFRPSTTILLRGKNDV